MEIGVQSTCINKFSTIRGNFYCIIPRIVEKNAWFSENFTIIFVAEYLLGFQNQYYLRSITVFNANT